MGLRVTGLLDVFGDGLWGLLAGDDWTVRQKEVNGHSANLLVLPGGAGRDRTDDLLNAIQ